jgi:hypothetical protein
MFHKINACISPNNKNKSLTKYVLDYLHYISVKEADSLTQCIYDYNSQTVSVKILYSDTNKYHGFSHL